MPDKIFKSTVLAILQFIVTCVICVFTNGMVMMMLLIFEYFVFSMLSIYHFNLKVGVKDEEIHSLH